MNVFIAIPTYSGTVRADCVSSLIANLFDLCQRGIEPSIQFMQGNSHIGFARNLMVSLFLKSECSHLIFVDDDVAFPSAGIAKLLSHDVELVGGVYPLKRDEPGFPARVIDQPGGDLVECDSIPTGFMCISRSLLERMIAAMPERKFMDYSTGEVHYNLFPAEIAGGTWWGEDYRFCHLAADFTKVWCDKTIEMSHIGSKTYRGDFEKWLEDGNSGNARLKNEAA